MHWNYLEGLLKPTLLSLPSSPPTLHQNYGFKEAQGGACKYAFLLNSQVLSDESGDASGPGTLVCKLILYQFQVDFFSQVLCSALTDTKMNMKSYRGKRKGNAQRVLEQCGKGYNKYVSSEEFVSNTDLGESKNTFQKECLYCLWRESSGLARWEGGFQVWRARQAERISGTEPENSQHAQQCVPTGFGEDCLMLPLCLLNIFSKFTQDCGSAPPHTTLSSFPTLFESQRALPGRQKKSHEHKCSRSQTWND